jgi:hypothetical protein
MVAVVRCTDGTDFLVRDIMAYAAIFDLVFEAS